MVSDTYFSHFSPGQRLGQLTEAGPAKIGESAGTDDKANVHRQTGTLERCECRYHKIENQIQEKQEQHKDRNGHSSDGQELGHPAFS